MLRTLKSIYLCDRDSKLLMPSSVPRKLMYAYVNMLNKYKHPDDVVWLEYTYKVEARMHLPSTRNGQSSTRGT